MIPRTGDAMYMDNWTAKITANKAVKGKGIGKVIPRNGMMSIKKYNNLTDDALCTFFYRQFVKFVA
jgi:hypothetical protein